MKSTTRNFWKMIDDRNVTAIVMLCPEIENNEVITIYSCFLYTVSHIGGLLSVLAFITK